MSKNKPHLILGKPFGKPSKTNKVNLGDLVKVVYLPQHKWHFDILTGVVSELSKYDNDFFITPIDSEGKEIPSGKTGWYSPENVEVLVEGYKQVTVTYKPLPVGVLC